MKQECASVFGLVKRRFSRKVCEQCAKETIHQGVKCLTCGHLHAVRGIGTTRSTGDRMRATRAFRKQLNRDRREALARAAAESREKFEGRK